MFYTNNTTANNIKLSSVHDVDIRSSEAYNIFEKYPNGNLLMHKVVRGGATTSILLESLNRNEKFVCIVPTNKIAKDTVVQDLSKYSHAINTIMHIPANHQCIKNQKKIEKCPDLGKLPILPLADSCEDCKKIDCQIKKVLEYENIDGLVLTLNKLSALMLASDISPDSVAGQIMNKIKESKNVLVDEAHELQFGEIKELEIYNNKGSFNLNKYNAVIKDFKAIKEILSAFKVIMKSITEGRNKKFLNDVHENAKNIEYYNKHLSNSIKTPIQYTLDGGFLGNSIDASRAIYSEIIKLTQRKESYGIDINDILDLYSIFCIVFSRIISINAIRVRGIVTVKLSVVDLSFMRRIKSFISDMEENEDSVPKSSDEHKIKNH
jgi:hypothetical protein